MDFGQASPSSLVTGGVALVGLPFWSAPRPGNVRDAGPYHCESIEYFWLSAVASVYILNVEPGEKCSPYQHGGAGWLGPQSVSFCSTGSRHTPAASRPAPLWPPKYATTRPVRGSIDTRAACSRAGWPASGEPCWVASANLIAASSYRLSIVVVMV